MQAHSVATLQGIRRQFEISRKAAIVREQQQAFAVQVEPADADHARKAGRQMGKDSRTIFFVARGGHETRQACDTRTGAALRTAGNGLPSTMILSFGPTVNAGVSSIFPLTLTRPSAIHRSASRREQSPARAMTLAMRSDSVAVFKGWRRSVMDFAGGSCPKEIILAGTVRDKWKGKPQQVVRTNARPRSQWRKDG